MTSITTTVTTSTSATTTPTPLNACSPGPLLVGSAIMGVACAVAAAAFTSVGALGGAVFGVTTFLSNQAINWICDKMQICEDNLLCKIAKCVLGTIGGIGVSVLITAALGFPITFGTGVMLTVVAIGSTIGTVLAFGGCFCSSAIASGIAFANNQANTNILA